MIRGAEETSLSSGQQKSSFYNAGTYDIYWLGLTIVIGGQLIYWNEGNFTVTLSKQNSL
jgi:hypothetical protein